MSNIVQKYLKLYAEPEVQLLDGFPQDLPYQNVVVVPCYQESADFVWNLTQSLTPHIPASTKILVIVIINQPETDDDETPQHTLQCFFEQRGTRRFNRNNLSLYSSISGLSPFDFLLVDRFHGQRKLPAKQGVGLARKIGCDIAVKMGIEKHITSHWIYSTDGDVTLPANYFAQPLSNNTENTSALVFNFHHQGKNQSIDQATQLYEQAIKYFRDQLQQAGSPYGYNTLGSTLAVSREHYCMVRGFPKRSAAEDFYLLNKLAKVGQIKSVDDITILIQSRLSNRVPFGTGPAVQTIQQKIQNNIDYTYYAPMCFTHLRELLCIVSELEPDEFCQEYQHTLFTPKTLAALKSLGLEKFIQHTATQISDKQNFIKAFHDWFDGFKTLKFIRYLQERDYPPVPIHECLTYNKRP
ncbi:hypothetical protein [Teredinibacter sp. KSP-S5-2]|uniref:hypothetical protein n=1 Tax=Teredinibacter sp. KSP-S5-2 TaxID=3034506 RepID=UPI0029342870|nr:hypothetical protein [Teredinibacter sp. KSP-S5-2]WNO09804.1 hypothetical protein P5V12_01270 [Teredinibacter sp. KSP-S5-2]